MKRTTTIIVIMFSLSFYQECPEPSMNLNVYDASALNEFISSYGDCPSYTLQELNINFVTGITSLAGLEGLTEVTRGINIIANPSLNNLDALSSLVSVGGTLNIYDNNSNYK